MAGSGIVMAASTLQFWVVFLLVFIIFGTLLSLLSSGLGAINLFFSADFPVKMQILGDGFLSFFGKDRYFFDTILNIAIALLQSLLVALIALVYKKRKQNSLYHKQIELKHKNSENKHSQKKSKHRQDTGDSEAIQNAGIAAGLALLGSGCPTCGTTLITPILASVFSSSSYAIAGTISGIITFCAILLLLWSLKRVGVEAYAIIIDERWRQKRQKVEEHENS